MGNCIHHVLSNSHTSGATVCDSGHAAALPARNSGSQGLKQDPQHCPRCPPKSPGPAHAALPLLPWSFSPARSGGAAAEVSGKATAPCQGLHICSWSPCWEQPCAHRSRVAPPPDTVVAVPPKNRWREAHVSC